MERVSAGQAVLAFQVERRQDLAYAHAPREARRHGLERTHDRVPEPLAMVVPGAVAQLVWNPLDVGGEDVRAVRGLGDE